MASVATQKRKCDNKSVKRKYEDLMLLDKGTSPKDVMSTLSTWEKQGTK